MGMICTCPRYICLSDIQWSLTKLRWKKCIWQNHRNSDSKRQKKLRVVHLDIYKNPIHQYYEISKFKIFIYFAKQMQRLNCYGRKNIFASCFYFGFFCLWSISFIHTLIYKLEWNRSLLINLWFLQTNYSCD